ncbi:hypothetical protein J2T20_004692 [Paenibacillus wynnii]|nr:hypothetical protein [Paenibacillus wynnii]
MVIRGFGDLEVKKKLNEMFEARYPVQEGQGETA